MKNETSLTKFIHELLAYANANKEHFRTSPVAELYTFLNQQEIKFKEIEKNQMLFMYKQGILDSIDEDQIRTKSINTFNNTFQQY